MKMELKNKVEKLIENYKKVTNAFLEEISKWESNSYYTSDAKQDEIRKVKAQMLNNDADFNKQLLNIIKEEKEAILNSTIKKPADYQVLISNAIGFINLLGNKLTDEEAFELVKPFFGDYQTMKRFYAVLSEINGLNVTIYSLGLFDKAVNNLEILKNNFAKFFDAGTYTTNGLAYTLKETALLSDIEDIERIIQKLDSIIPASYKEVEAELKNEMVV
ncbi:MAG: hypothetical protein JG759_152 [Thermoanaerobacter sp.]|jgi:hypothetical protein|nr:hypothetical protein [Thermoanaerobacter sp.]